MGLDWAEWNGMPWVGFGGLEWGGMGRGGLGSQKNPEKQPYALLVTSLMYKKTKRKKVKLLRLNGNASPFFQGQNWSTSS